MESNEFNNLFDESYARDRIDKSPIRQLFLERDFNSSYKTRNPGGSSESGNRET